MNQKESKAWQDLILVSAEISALSKLCSMMPLSVDLDVLASNLADLSMRSFDATNLLYEVATGPEDIEVPNLISRGKK